MLNRLRLWYETWRLKRAIAKIFPPARGKEVDALAAKYGLQRKRWENDRNLRRRVLEVLRA